MAKITHRTYLTASGVHVQSPSGRRSRRAGRRLSEDATLLAEVRAETKQTLELTS
jgi:hypothetical protein